MKSFKEATYKDSGLGKWFSQSAGGKPGWDRYNTSGKRAVKCGDAKDGDPYSVCLSKEKADKLGPKNIASFVRRKRKAQKDSGRDDKGDGPAGKKPIMVKTGITDKDPNKRGIQEKNEPENPKLWDSILKKTRAKFDVYPSAYANAWASKEYKKQGGTWRKVAEAKVEQVEVTGDEIATILEFVMILDEGNEVILSEARAEDLKSLVGSVSKKLGFASSGRKNLLSLLSSISKNAALTVVYAIQAQAGREGAKEKLQNVLQTSNVKAELLDLVVRADVLTLHLISGPIHMIDALTGYEIADKIREKAEIGGNKVKDAVELIQKSAQSLSDNQKSRRVKKSLNTIRKVFTLK